MTIDREFSDVSASCAYISKNGAGTVYLAIEPLAFIFQSSFQSHTLPACWLHALVIPVFKKGLISDPSYYRPISLTYVCCRAMERIINMELLT